MSLHDVERRLFEVAGSMRNFADVADRCTITEVVNGPPSIRTWAEILDEIRGELAALACGGEAAPYRIWSIGGNQDGTATLSAVSEWRFFSERPFDTGDVVYVSRHPADAVQVTDEMVERALKAMRTGWHQNEITQMRAAIAAALNPGGSRE